MTRRTRRTKFTSGDTNETTKNTNMAANKELTLQDVIDQMKVTMKEVEQKLETKIDENAAKLKIDVK